MLNDAEIKAAMVEDLIAGMMYTQYYCEKCEQVFEYRAIDQYGCEQCNTAIQDNNIAEVAQ